MHNRQVILITGGSGLIGHKLREIFLAQGHEVRILGRGNKGKRAEGKYDWNPATGEIDDAALQGVTWLIHLAGEAVAGKRWTEARKKAIIDSRVQSTSVLVEAIKRTGHKPQKVLAASAVGYYGMVTVPHIFAETDPAGNDFLAHVCVLWEKETARFRTELNIPTVTVRIGVVLSAEGGALQQIVGPIRMYMGGILGSGKQWLPWIHVDDLTGIIRFALDTESVQGTYNAAAPQHTSFAHMCRAAAKSLHRPLLPVPVPGFAIKMILGKEQADIVLKGSRISTEKIQNAGYKFQFTDVQKACDDLL